MTVDDDEQLDEILGRSRCARCGQVLDGEIECPFCAMFPEPKRAQRTPKWVYLTACFLASPLSLPFLISTDRLSNIEKLFAGSGLLVWTLLYWLY